MGCPNAVYRSLVQGVATNGTRQASGPAAVGKDVAGHWNHVNAVDAAAAQARREHVRLGLGLLDRKGSGEQHHVLAAPAFAFAKTVPGATVGTRTPPSGSRKTVGPRRRPGPNGADRPSGRHGARPGGAP